MNVFVDKEEFIKHLQQHDQKAFKQFFYNWHSPLCFFASRIIKDSDVAEDLVQDVFVAFWKQDLNAFQNEKAMKTYLYNSLKNSCLNYLRDLEIQNRNNKNAVPVSEEDTDSFLLKQIESEVISELFQAIDELPERCREIFCMAYLNEKEEKQIAAQLNISVNTVKTQKLRAKSYLRERLGDLFVYTSLFFTGF